ncbi:MAG: metal-dependent transcriptional regulator [Deltaproteobacteria bacterium]|nr:MAG: metal-dependent transcriptional regulator [Deltaproteobacteria bacterium]
MIRKQRREEYLETLWSMKEEGKDSIEALNSAIGEDFDASIVDQLLYEDLVELTKDSSKILLTKKGEDEARRVIRSHRLAERLIYDVLGGEFESGACEFEHTIATELVDSICTLLGHPKECPHGNPIPQGECCKRFARTAESPVIPLTELQIGQSGRVAYVNYKNDQQFHRIDALQIRPGVVIKVHQKYPSYVIECENANIALDREVASNISIWKEPPQFQHAGRKGTEPARGWGSRFRRRTRGRYRIF